MTWLVTGCSGYIGQHVVQQLLLNGFEIIGLDLRPISNSSPLVGKFKSSEGDICDPELISEILNSYAIVGIINLAALKSVEESIEKPDLYEKVNFTGVKNLLSASKSAGVKFFIQSSTAAVYGSSEDGYVDELSPTNPISPYGETKLKAESALLEAMNMGILRGTSLRYFNVIGSVSPALKDTSTANIVPMVLSALAKNQSPKIFGDDYSTPDGTCVRDYVHVMDIAQAHVLAAKALMLKALPPAINIGTGKGYSVREMVCEILRQKGSSFVPEILPRRPGDPSMLVARVDLAAKVLSFKAERGLQEMVASAI
jgi:UDP-glucose 4-epimerase